jgi:hypothetical protein
MGINLIKESRYSNDLDVSPLPGMIIREITGAIV